MKTLVECTWERDEQKDDMPVYEKANYWLLYFGLDYKIIEVEEGKIAAVNFTIAVCQHYDTGQIECFRPEQLRIIGTKLE
jgi:hypothetical protein